MSKQVYGYKSPFDVDTNIGFNNRNSSLIGWGGDDYSGWSPIGGNNGQMDNDYFSLMSRRADQQDKILANQEFGFNMNTLNAGIGGLSALGNLWGGYQAQKMAKKQFDYQKGVTNTNLMNQIQSYNTALKDRITTRSHVQGDSQEKTDQYLKENSLKRHG